MKKRATIPVLCLIAMLLPAIAITGSLTLALGAEPNPDAFTGLAQEYDARTRPVLQQFCLSCHSTEKQEGDLDLERFANLRDVRRGTKVWLKVVEMLDNGEMPPVDSKQPSVEQKLQVRGWVDRYLRTEVLVTLAPSC